MKKLLFGLSILVLQSNSFAQEAFQIRGVHIGAGNLHNENVTPLGPTIKSNQTILKAGYRSLNVNSKSEIDLNSGMSQSLNQNSKINLYTQLKLKRFLPLGEIGFTSIGVNAAVCAKPETAKNWAVVDETNLGPQVGIGLRSIEDNAIYQFGAFLDAYKKIDDNDPRMKLALGMKYINKKVLVSCDLNIVDKSFNSGQKINQGADIEIGYKIKRLIASVEAKMSDTYIKSMPDIEGNQYKYESEKKYIGGKVIYAF